MFTCRMTGGDRDLTAESSTDACPIDGMDSPRFQKGESLIIGNRGDVGCVLMGEETEADCASPSAGSRTN
jgi:hypothetical protein